MNPKYPPMEHPPPPPPPAQYPPMYPQQYPSYMNGAPPPPPGYPMPPSASMPLTVAALSGSLPTKPSMAPVRAPPVHVGSQCDFCAGDEHENKVTKLPEQMITCKVRDSID